MRAAGVVGGGVGDGGGFYLPSASSGARGPIGRMAGNATASVEEREIGRFFFCVSEDRETPQNSGGRQPPRDSVSGRLWASAVWAYGRHGRRTPWINRGGA